MARAIRTDRGWTEIHEGALTTGNVLMWGGSDFMCSTVAGAGATGPTGPTGPTGVLTSGAVTGNILQNSLATGVIFYSNGTIFTTLGMGATNSVLQIVGSTLVYSTVAGGSGASTITATLSWGTTSYQKFKEFSITDADATTTHRIIGNVLYVSTDLGGKQLDEYEMDSFELKFRALSGSVACAMRSLEGSFAGTVLVSYIRQ